jgi:hypothetical protein
MMQMGYDAEDFAGQAGDRASSTPGRTSTLPCAFQAARRGREARRLQAGGFPLELPAISLSEPIVKPTTMLYRNLLAMETEELLRSTRSTARC